MADTKFEVILGMFFLKFSNTDVLFGEKTLMWKTYTINKILSTTEQVQIINKKNLAIAAMDTNSKTFVVYIAIQKQEDMPIYFKR